MENETQNQVLRIAQKNEDFLKNSNCLHKEFVKLSFDIIKMKNKLISLLLEIYEKEIYKERGCRTIHEYGFKYAKLSRELVNKAIRTLKHLENKPFLKQVIETQGIHKVALVATIATPENEKIFAGHIRNMSKPALFEFTKELRHNMKNGEASGQKSMFAEKIGYSENLEEHYQKDESARLVTILRFCQAVPSKMQIELDTEMQTLFLKFKEKYAKNLSNREALRVMLKKMEAPDQKVIPGNVIVKKSNQVIDEKPVPAYRTGRPGNDFGQSATVDIRDYLLHENEKNVFPSRRIRNKKDQEIRLKYHHKCAYPGCVKTVEVMHHRIPFAFERSHESVIPLCDVHHEFAHNGLIAHELLEPENWQLKTEGSTSIFDQFYLQNRHV